MKISCGFTLIEISIVMVIVGLLVGGILVGRELIATAQMRGVLKVVEQSNTAVNTFRVKYNCLPGDCANITNYFIQRSSCDPGEDVTVFNPATCNGNGNGLIGGGTISTDPEVPESFLLWQHLALAYLINGNFTGKVNLSYQDPVARQNVPSLNFRSGRNGEGLIDISYFSSFQQSAQAAIFSSPTSDGLLNRHITQLGINYGNGHSRAGDPLFTANEALAIDRKADDGKANTGNMRATTYSGTCQDGSGNYLNSNEVSSMQDNRKGCSLYIGAPF